MDKFYALLSLMAFVLVFEQRLMMRVDGRSSSETIRKEGMDDFIGVVAVGAIVDTSSRIGMEERVAMEIAVHEFNTSNQTLVLYLRNSGGDPLQAALAARDLINTNKVQAILGPQTWEEVSLVAEIGNQSQIPIISLANATPNWATNLWSFLVQASPTQLKQMEAVAAVVQSWEWHQVIVIYEDKDFSASAILSHLSKALKQVGAQIVHFVALPPFASSSSVSENLERLKMSSQCRVFVVHLSLPAALKLFEKAKGLEMMEKGYVWITTDHFTSLVHSLNASTISSLQGIVGVKSYFHENESHFRHFSSKFRGRFRSQHPEEGNYEPSIFAVQTYGAARTVALAVREKTSRGQNILANFLRSNFDGLRDAHTFQIINVMGESFIELGFWSDGLGFSESVGENSRFSPSMKDLGKVSWPGRPQQTPQGWSPPTKANPLKIGVPARATFKHYVNVEVKQDYLGNNVSSYGGLSVDLFEATLRELPFDLPFEFFPFDGTFDALVEQIYLKKFDAAVGGISILAKRSEHAGFTAPYSESGLVMIVPVGSGSRRSNKAWLFIKPFTNSMWVLIGATSIYNGFVIWFIERNKCPELEGSLSNQIGTLIWLSSSTLFSLNGNNKLKSNLSRITMVVWLFMALVITQTYTANVASLLTVPQLHQPTTLDVESLQNRDAMVGCSRVSYVQSYLEDVLHFQTKNIKNFSSPDQFTSALQSKEIAAFFLDLPLAKIFLAEHCKSFTITGPVYKVGGYGFAFQRGSPLLPSVTQAMLKVSESGEFQELENKMLASEKCEEKEADEKPLSLTLGPSYFWVLFVFTGGTSSIALLIYIFGAYNSMPAHTVIWKLMMVVIKEWGNQKRRFSRKVSDIQETNI